MARYTGPKWRINRREGATVKGVSDKWKRRPGKPGQHGRGYRLSAYGVQFREKQKVKRTYGLMEKQFRRFFRQARKYQGNTGTRLLQLLELRIDNVVFKLGLAKTRAQARQFVNHGHILLNGKKHDIPSTILKPGDEIKLKSKFQKSPVVTILKEELKNVQPPKWLKKLPNGGVVESEPTREMIDQSIRERLIIELYSR